MTWRVRLGLGLVGGHVVVELARGDRFSPAWSMERGVAAAVAVAALAFVAWRARRSGSRSLPSAALVVAGGPALVLGALTAAEGLARADAVEAGRPLWELTQLLVEPADGLDVGLRASAALFGGLAVVVGASRGRSSHVVGAALGAYAALIVASAAAPVSGGVWLGALVGLWWVRRPYASVLAALAVTSWVLADHAWLWLVSLSALGADGPRAISASTVVEPVDAARFILPVWVVLPAWAAACVRMVTRTAPPGRGLLASLALVPALVAFGVWSLVLETHSAAALEPPPSSEVLHGLPVVAGRWADGCVATVTTEVTVRRLVDVGCDDVELVGAGPSMRMDRRVARLGAWGSVPDVPRASSLRVTLDPRASGLSAPEALVLDGSRGRAVRPGDAITIAVGETVELSSVARWADTLAEQRIGLVLAIGEAEPPDRLERGP